MIKDYGTGNYGDGTFGGDAPANTYGADTYGSGTYGQPSAQTLSPSLFTNTQAFFSPTVTQTGATKTLTPSLFTNTQQFFTAVISVGAVARSGSQGWILQQQRKRKFNEERDERDQLRKAIELAVDPVTEKTAQVVTVKGEVAVVTKSQTILLPIPPQFDAQAVAKMAVAVLEARQIEAQRVRDAENRRKAAIALQALRAEMERKRIKRKREEEMLLLM